MLLTIVILLACAVTIYLACEYFVNGIEWLGQKLQVGENATGTILAAFGTALPESAVTLAAVAFGSSEASKQIGVGAAHGGPLVLATLSYGMVGLVLWCNARKLNRPCLTLQTNQKRLSRDQGWFLGIFALKMALGLVLFTGKHWLALLFVAAYALYVWKELGVQEEEGELELEPLKLQPRNANPATAMVVLQTVGALTVVALASHYFVGGLTAVAPMLGMQPQWVALLLAPIATELPETMNAIIWVRQGKEKLALANISGAMMIQATIPSALGIYFTSWMFDSVLLLAGAVTMVAITVLFFLFRAQCVRARTLVLTALLYGVFVAGALLV